MRLPQLLSTNRGQQDIVGIHTSPFRPSEETPRLMSILATDGPVRERHPFTLGLPVASCGKDLVS